MSGVKAKVCILPGETFIESHLKSEGAFEADTVNAIVKAMTVYKDATFLGKILVFFLFNCVISTNFQT